MSQKDAPQQDVLLLNTTLRTIEYVLVPEGTSPLETLSQQHPNNKIWTIELPRTAQRVCFTYMDGRATNVKADEGILEMTGFARWLPTAVYGSVDMEREAARLPTHMWDTDVEWIWLPSKARLFRPLGYYSVMYVIGGSDGV